MLIGHQIIAQWHQQEAQNKLAGGTLTFKSQKSHSI